MNFKLLIATFCCVATVSAQAAYKDGTYTGSGKGNASTIELSVTVKGGKIVKIDILKQGETPMIFEAASGTIIPAVIEKNGIEGIEAVTGASNSSKGIITAVKNALEKASK